MVVVWFALMLVVLIGMAAFAVDVTAWHLTQTREQRAADAAALAGAVTYPSDASTSNAAALGIAGNNGYSVAGMSPLGPGDTCPLDSGETTKVCAGPGDKPYQYRVKVVQRVDNMFGGILGMQRTDVSAIGTAEFLRPLAMGSPSNQYGNDPDKTAWPIDAANPPATYPNFWGNIEGGGTAKQQGDAYAANWCESNSGRGVDGCTAIGGVNNDSANGYFYSVDFTSAATTRLQVFDPAFVNVSNLCTSNATGLATAAGLPSIPHYPQGATNTGDISKRFKLVTNANDPTDPGYEYCTGDQIFPTPTSNNSPPLTTYRVLKATVPGDPSSAHQVCPDMNFPGYNGDISVPLAAGTQFPGAPGYFAQYFRQWFTLCQVSGAAGDQFFIQVTTDGGGGSNHFSMRGVDSGNSASPVNIAGNAKMGIFTNVGSNQLTKFHLVRVPTAAASHTLVMNFFDIGDANSGTVGQLQVRPPPDANIGSTFDDCTWTGSGGSAVGYATNTPSSPWGDKHPIPGCLITGVNNDPANWNAQWSTVTVQIPSNYTCNDSDPKGCWVTIEEKFNGAVHDVTSWSATLLGDPVRLVK